MMADAPPSAFVVSLDFEQAWGREPNRIGPAEEAAFLGARRAIPRMLDLAERHATGFTWASVGLLFFDTREEMLACLPERRPTYADPQLDAYRRMTHVGRDERHDPLHFGRSLLLRIRDCPHQEIATHSFSHYYALEDGDDAEAFAADLLAAGRAAETLGLRMKSLVFPRNQVNPRYLSVCRAFGLTSYRGAQPSPVHAARARSEERPLQRLGRAADAYCPFARNSEVTRASVDDGLVNIPASHFLRPAMPRMKVLNELQLARILGEMRRIARKGGIFHLWWHPQNFGADLDLNLDVLGRILKAYRDLADGFGMRSLTMAQLAETCLAHQPMREANAA